MPKRLLEPALLHERIAQIVVGFGMHRIEAYALPIMRHRFVQAAERSERIADIAVEIRGTIVARDRLADEVDGNFIAAGLVRDHAEKMHAIGVVGIEREYLAIKPLRLVEAAGLMQCQGRSQGLSDVQAHVS